MLMSGRILGFMATFVIPLVLVRVFSKNEFGTYKQLFLIYTTLYGIVQLGMAESLFYFLPGAGSRQSGRYVFNAVWVLVAAGSLCFLLLWYLRATIARWFHNPALAGYVPLIGLFLLFMLSATVLEIVMISNKRHLYASSTYVVSDFLRAVACILPAILFQSLEWLLIGLVIFSGFRFLGTLLYLRHTEHSELRPDTTLLWKQFAYAFPFAVAVVIEIVQINFHMYVVSSSYDVATFAIYAVGCLQIPLVDFLMTSTSNVMMVRIRENIQNGDSGSIPGIWLDTTRKLMLLFAPLVGGLLVVAHPLIVVLFTKNYISSVPLFMLWTVSILFSALLTDSILRVYARTKLLIVLYFIQLVIIAGMIRLFMSWFGLEGAVLVSLLAMAVAKAAALYSIKHILKTGIRQVLPWNSISITLTITAVAAVPALLIENNLSLPLLPLTLITGLSYAGMYVALLFFCGPLSRTEKHDLIAWLKWPLLRAYRNFVS